MGQQVDLGVVGTMDAGASFVSDSSAGNNEKQPGGTAARETDDAPAAPLSKKELRRQHKQAVKAQKAARRAKRMGQDVESGRKACQLCEQRVDLLIRCTVDATQQYKLVCGRCWKDVSGGVPDGDADHPYGTRLHYLLRALGPRL